MATPALHVHFASLSLKPREISASQPNYRKPISFSSLNKSISLSRAANPSESAPSTSISEKPEIELEFIGPKPGPDGTYPVDKASAISGDKLLRNIMLDNKLELYATYGKVMNCGGGGSCGTCIVEVVDGKDLLNERTNTELRYLKKKPESWRLSCQTIVGNKENSGKDCTLSQTCLSCIIRDFIGNITFKTYNCEATHLAQVSGYHPEVASVEEMIANKWIGSASICKTNDENAD